MSKLQTNVKKVRWMVSKMLKTSQNPEKPRETCKKESNTIICMTSTREKLPQEVDRYPPPIIISIKARHGSKAAETPYTLLHITTPQSSFKERSEYPSRP